MKTASGLAEESISPFTVRPGQLVTSPSYLLDRFQPDCEIVFLPEKRVAGGVLRYGRGNLVPPPGPKGVKGWLSAGPARRQHDRPLIDLRLRSPQNWAHFLTNHLPITFRVTDAMGLGCDEVSLLLPQKTPGYISAAAGLFGFDVLCSDDAFEGENILFQADPWTGIRPARAGWMQSPAVVARLEALLRDGQPLPRRFFLPRRQTRVLENQAEIEAFLTRLGFVTIYPEDLAVADQFRLFHEAEVIVAVHGAALAPLLYRRPGSRLKQLIEILPCGHMTDVYRVMADQLGVAWIGVRGQIKPEYVSPAYDFSKEFKAFSLDSFRLDIKALEQASMLAEHPLTERGNG
jgi:capsular polysaccharide biosynthesis protein